MVSRDKESWAREIEVHCEASVRERFGGDGIVLYLEAILVTHVVK